MNKYPRRRPILRQLVFIQTVLSVAHNIYTTDAQESAVLAFRLEKAFCALYAAAISDEEAQRIVNNYGRHQIDTPTTAKLLRDVRAAIIASGNTTRQQTDKQLVDLS
jgi:hypothetical protein